MHWTDLRMASFDIETTGVDVEECRIVSASLVHVGGGEPTCTQAWLINPGVEIPQEAIDVHGITNEQVQGSGLEPRDALTKLCTQFYTLPVGTPLIVFNPVFDLTVFDRECRRWRLPSLDLGGVFVVDPLLLDRHLNKYRKGSRKLVDQCAHYGAKLDEAHEAESDALAAARLAWLIGRRGQVVRRVRNRDEAIERALLVKEWDAVKDDLAKLQAFQVRIGYAAAASLEEYFRKGNPKKDVPPQPDRVVPRDWPMIPYSKERDDATGERVPAG